MRETDFYFPLQRVDSHDIADIIRAGDDHMHELYPLIFSPAKGYMKGVMDLVLYVDDKYYLIDWKSNYLGGSYDHYCREALSETMYKNYYMLQYRLYLVALHCYLKLRIPNYSYDEHIGGVAYVFLRGLETNQRPDCGVYFDRLSCAEVESLCKRLVDEDK